MHTMTLRYPEVRGSHQPIVIWKLMLSKILKKPSPDERDALKSYFYLMSRLYRMCHSLDEIASLKQRTC